MPSAPTSTTRLRKRKRVLDALAGDPALLGAFPGKHAGRVMYVLPCELATGTPMAEAGVQITDDPGLSSSSRAGCTWTGRFERRHATCAPSAPSTPSTPSTRATPRARRRSAASPREGRSGLPASPRETTSMHTCTRCDSRARMWRRSVAFPREWPSSRSCPETALTSSASSLRNGSVARAFRAGRCGRPCRQRDR